jgi:hypothetical protein
MRIQEFIWLQDRIDFISQHGLTAEDMEQMCYRRPLVQRARVRQVRSKDQYALSTLLRCR